MYCPSCGSEERQLSQFCRGCGTDLRVVRTSLERPDAITASAISAREQIGLAVADKIRQMETARDLEKVAEDVLPHIEKFLESPAEKRMRRIRNGVITAAIGFAITIITFLIALNESDVFPLVLPGFITFMIGIGTVVNGLLFTVPKKELPGNAFDELSLKGPEVPAVRPAYEAPPHVLTNELGPARQQTPSITEHTTHHLSNKS
jgi:hypothetical protein